MLVKTSAQCQVKCPESCDPSLDELHDDELLIFLLFTLNRSQLKFKFIKNTCSFKTMR